MATKLSSDVMIKFIKQQVNLLTVEERNSILQTLLNSSIDESKIQEKGDGTQIKWCYIPDSILAVIYNYVKNRLDIKQKELSSFTG